MKLTAPYRCDYCPNTRGDGNHWFLQAINDGIPAFRLYPWKADKPDLQDANGMQLYAHICSEECATKALSRWMGEQKPMALREPLDPLGGDWAKAEGR